MGPRGQHCVKHMGQSEVLLGTGWGTHREQNNPKTPSVHPTLPKRLAILANVSCLMA